MDRRAPAPSGGLVLYGSIKTIADDPLRPLIGVVPIRTRFEGGTLRITASGHHVWADVHAALKAATAQDALGAGRSILVMAVSDALATHPPEELRDIASDLARIAPRFAAMLLVTADELRFRLARMVAVYAEHLGVEILVFRSTDAAEAWVRAQRDGERQVR